MPKTTTTTTKVFTKDEIVTALMDTYGLKFDQYNLSPVEHTESSPSMYPSDSIDITIFDGVQLTYTEL